MNESPPPIGRSWIARLARLQPWYLLVRYPNRLTRSIFAFVNGFVSIGVMTGAAIYTGQALIFPSLGPSAFLFFSNPSAPASCPRNAILGHASGVALGWISFQLAILAFGEGTLGAQIAAAALSLGLVSALMIGAKLLHPPAASTALIVALGIFTEWHDLAAILVAAVLLTIQAFVFNRLSGIDYPIWAPRDRGGKEGIVASALATDAPDRTPDPYASVADQLVSRKKVTPPKKPD